METQQASLARHLHEQYEQLREEALNDSQPARGQGLMALLSRGTADWIQSLKSLHEPPQHAPATALAMSGTGEVDPEWVLMLAALVLGEAVRHD